MILAIDIGNTNIVVGCLDEQRTYFIDRLATNRFKTEVEYALDLKTVLALHQIQPEEIEGSIISSVVPQITDSTRGAIKMVLKKEPLLLEPGMKTGLSIVTDQPSQVGRDRVADAVGALAAYPPPLIIIDLGTATTISVINAQRQFIGGLILPGIRVSLDALTARTSQLGGISIDVPKQIIGRNTIDSMKSGILYGNAAALDGIIDRIEAELGQKTTIVATGGWSGRILPHCKRDIIREEDLLLKGLLTIYHKNSTTTQRRLPNCSSFHCCNPSCK